MDPLSPAWRGHVVKCGRIHVRKTWDVSWSVIYYSGYARKLIPDVPTDRFQLRGRTKRRRRGRSFDSESATGIGIEKSTIDRLVDYRPEKADYRLLTFDVF